MEDIEEQLLLAALERSDDEGGDGIVASSSEEEDPVPKGLTEDECYTAWTPTGDLDLFFYRIYYYWESQGFWMWLTSQTLNVAALLCAGALSGFLLLFVDYDRLGDPCLRQGTCSIYEVCTKNSLWEALHPLTFWKFLSLLYLVAFVAYAIFAVVYLMKELQGMQEVRMFVTRYLGYSERSLKASRWNDVLARVVRAQEHVRFCRTRELTEQDLVMRIMRKENYLIALLNKGILSLSFSNVSGMLPKAPLLTKTVEWNIRLCLLDGMFDTTTNRVKESFMTSPETIVQRLRFAAICNLLLAPFLLAFLVIYYVMKNAEALYHQPGSMFARQWSPVAIWQLREFNEVPYFLYNRLNSGHESASKYMSQFPNYWLSHVSRFTAFVAGSFAAVLTAATLIEDGILEMNLIGERQTVWWLAVLGAVLAISRSQIVEGSSAAFDPELALLEVAAHTHHYPKHWRGRAHTIEVQDDMKSLFRYKAVVFFEELLSVVLTPMLLWRVLPLSACNICQFLRENTEYVSGVGDVCSFAAFDIAKHGNAKYGCSINAPKRMRSKNGKMEKSIISFSATNPAWNPPEHSRQMIQNVDSVLFDLEENPSGLNDYRASYMNGGWSGKNSVKRFLLSYYPHIAKILLHTSENQNILQSVLLSSRNEAGPPQGPDVDPGKKTMIMYSMMQYFHDNQERIRESLQSISTEDAQQDQEKRQLINELSVLK